MKPYLQIEAGPDFHPWAGIRGLFVRIWLVLALAGCAVPISYYDATSYKQLTDLKVEAVTLVSTFGSKPLSSNEPAIADVTMKLEKAYEYEKGKGSKNSLTMQQLEKIVALFKEDVQLYRGQATDLGPGFFQEAATALGQAFDIAIATENLKNKDKH